MQQFLFCFCASILPVNIASFSPVLQSILYGWMYNGFLSVQYFILMQLQNSISARLWKMIHRARVKTFKIPAWNDNMKWLPWFYLFFFDISCQLTLNWHKVYHILFTMSVHLRAMTLHISYLELMQRTIFIIIALTYDLLKVSFIQYHEGWWCELYSYL